MPPPIAGAGPSPDGCVQESATAGPGYCDSYYRCAGSNYMQVTCKDNGTGSGDCYCSSSTGTQQFQISGTPTFETCGSAAQLCLAGGEPSAEEECTPSFTSSASTSCQLQERCTRSIEGSDATIARTRSVSCSGGDPVTCYCDYSGNQFRLDADSSEGACETIIQHCDDPRVPAGGGPVTCEPRSQQSGMGYCSVYEECLSETDIGDGISAVSIEGRNATCQSSASGGSICTCQGSSVAVQFEIDAPANSLAPCLSATEICGNGGQLELDGETECLPQNQSAGTTDCYASLDCTKEGTIGDQAVRVHGYLGLSCYGQGGAYDCTCSSNRESESLTVEADTAWAACSSAVAQCPELVEPAFDGGNVGAGGGVGVPLPMPGSMGGRF